MTISLGFEKARDAQLHHAGLCYKKDVWKNGAFISAAFALVKFGLKHVEAKAWLEATTLLTKTYSDFLGRINPMVDPKKWVGIFDI